MIYEKLKECEGFWELSHDDQDGFGLTWNHSAHPTGSVLWVVDVERMHGNFKVA